MLTAKLLLCSILKWPNRPSQSECEASAGPTYVAPVQLVRDLHVLVGGGGGHAGMFEEEQLEAAIRASMADAEEATEPSTTATAAKKDATATSAAASAFEEARLQEEAEEAEAAATRSTAGPSRPRSRPKTSLAGFNWAEIDVVGLMSIWIACSLNSALAFCVCLRIAINLTCDYFLSFLPRVYSFHPFIQYNVQIDDMFAHFNGEYDKKIEPIQVGDVDKASIALMSIQCNPSIHPWMIKRGGDMVEVLRNNNQVLNPFCPFLEDIIDDSTKFKGTAAVYAKMKRNSRVPSKIGQTTNMRQRFDAYCREGGTASTNIVVLVDFDNIPMDVDAELVGIYYKFMEEILEMEDVPDEMKIWVRTLIKREGETLGPKRRIVLSMIESGVQDYFKKELGREPGPSEAFLFDENVFQERKEYANDVASTLVELLVRLGVSREVAAKALASWATAYDGDKVKKWDEEKDGPTPTVLSSQLVLTEYCVSPSSWEDALPYPANPGARDEDLAFSTKEYTSRGKFALACFYFPCTFHLLQAANSSSLSFCPVFNQQMFSTVATELASGSTRSVASGESIYWTTTVIHSSQTTSLKVY